MAVQTMGQADKHRVRAVDEPLVRRLVAKQFPDWGELPISLISPGGWDHRIFRLGDNMAVRLPSAAEYSTQVEKEQLWLPKLARSLPLDIPTLLAKGLPTPEYPWRWSVYRWINGETATAEGIGDIRDFATTLAAFLIALHHIDVAGGPRPGAHNFFRGGLLATYEKEARKAIEILGAQIDTAAATKAWDRALETEWGFPPVWVHGDISPGNLLVREGKLAAVIDFGMLAIGDPACDLCIAWTLFSGKSREAFQNCLTFDTGTWARARGWTLWKALVVAAGLVKTNAVELRQPLRLIEDLLS